MAGHAGDRETVAAGLIDDRPGNRRTALGAAARLGMLTAESLRPHLDDPDVAVRHRAVELAARLPDGHRLADTLIGLLGPGPAAPSPPGRGHTPDPTGPTQDDDAIDALAEVAAFAVGELDLDQTDRPRAVAALGRQATEHGDPLCRESAVAALGALGAGLDFILAASTDVATVRRRAVLALAPFDGPAVDETIERALEDRDWQVRQAAEDLIGPDPGAEATQA